MLINASFCPSENLVNLIKGLQENQAIFYNDEPLAFFAKEDQEIDFTSFSITEYTDDDILRVEHTWDIFEKNPQAIQRDFDLLTQGRTSEAIPKNTVAYNPQQIFIEKGAKVMCTSLNATDGPIYIGKETIVMEGATLQGPFALCAHSTVKMGAKIYAGTTIGPHCKVAGIVLGNTRNERSHRAMRTIYNDMCTYADRNNAFLPIFLAPSVHVYGSGCRVDIYGSGRYRLVEAAWDILYTRIFWRLSLQCV